MKFITSIILIALLSFSVCLYLPWYTIAIAAFIVTALIHQTPLRAFLSGFIALFVLWAFLAYLISSQNGHLLAHKVSVLVVGGDRVYILILLTAIIGGLVGGSAALAGSFLTRSVEKAPKEPVL